MNAIRSDQNIAVESSAIFQGDSRLIHIDL